MTITKPDLSKPVSLKDWELVEDYYVQTINPIQIPEDPKPYDITSINAQLGRLYHEARLDLFYVTRAFDKIEDAYRKLKRALYPITKTGKNAEERDHLMQDHLMQVTLDQLDPNIVKSLGLPALPTTVYVLYETYKERVDFIKTVIEMIRDKSDRLITDSGAMKIESRFSN